MVRNESTNHRLAFGGKSQERDGTPFRSEGHSDEFTVSIWKKYGKCLQK